MAGGVMTTGLRNIVPCGDPLRMNHQGFHRLIGGKRKIVRPLPDVADLAQLAAIESGIFGAASPPTSR